MAAVLASVAVLLLAAAVPGRAQEAGTIPTPGADPLVIGETFTLQSRVLGEERRINVYRPPAWAEPPDAPRPVLYMPDGGIHEDFVHVAGLLQISVLNGTMRPFLLVGIENTQRRRDLTPPTEVEADRSIAPVVGGSAAFRAFVRTELMPEVRARYPTTGETAIIGESLAGLFIVETFFLEPTLFDTYVAIDPSLWWNGAELVEGADDRLRTLTRPGDGSAEAPAGALPESPARTLYLATSGEPGIAALTERLADALAGGAPETVRWHLELMPDEMHATIYHPAALRAFRHLFAPARD